MTKWRLIIVIFFLAATLFQSTAVLAGEVEEYDLKAAFVLNFLKLTEQPEPLRSAPICVLTKGSSRDSFEELRGKSVGETVVRVVVQSSLPFPGPCRALFVASDRADMAAEALKLFTLSATLTVGEQSDFLSLGGLIDFFIEDSKIRFEVRHETAVARGISVSSKLMQLSRARKRSRE